MKPSRARSKNWSLSRMPRVDLNVMRLAAYELMFRCRYPQEGQQSTRRSRSSVGYGDKESPAFVNGILDEIEACAKTELTSEEQ